MGRHTPWQKYDGIGLLDFSLKDRIHKKFETNIKTIDLSTH